MFQKIARFVSTIGAMAMIVMLFALSSVSASAASPTPGAVYVLTNAANDNAVAAFHRAANGTLNSVGTFSTGGLGSGSGLGSQGALVLSADGRRLFAVNAGSNDISIFDVQSNGLKLRGKTSSHGSTPISLSVHDNLLYVLNSGGTANITGFKINEANLKPIPGSTRPLSAAAPGPAEVAFSADGKFLVVTEKSTNKIDVYKVNDDGVASAPIISTSNGATPFGFAFNNRGYLIVSEAGPGAVSSYTIEKSGKLSVISPSVVAVGQLAACWIAVSKDGRYAYAADAHSGTITGYRVSNNGKLSLLDANAITANPGGAPLDMGVSQDGRNLYVFNTGLQTINAYTLKTNGELSSLGNTGALPTSASGIAVW